MDRTKWRAGVIGSGFIGQAHLEALQRVGVEVMGLVDYNPAGPDDYIGRLVASQFRTYKSVEELLGDGQVDVVHIASPNHLHVTHAMAALEAGKHVVCEAPLAMDTRQFADLLRLARDRQLLNAVNFNLRYYPANQYSWGLVGSGRVGEVYTLRGSYLHDWRVLQGSESQRLTLPDIGSLWIDLTCFITCLQAEEVVADFGVSEVDEEYPLQSGRGTGYGSVLIRYAGGARGVLAVSQVTAGRNHRICYEIDGSRAAAVWDSDQPGTLRVGYLGRPSELVVRDEAPVGGGRRASGFADAVHQDLPFTFRSLPDTLSDFYFAVYNYLDGRDPEAIPDFPTFEDGHRQLLVAEAILRSAREQRWVPVGDMSVALS